MLACPLRAGRLRQSHSTREAAGHRTEWGMTRGKCNPEHPGLLGSHTRRELPAGPRVVTHLWPPEVPVRVQVHPAGPEGGTGEPAEPYLCPRWHFGVETRRVAASCLCFPAETAPPDPDPSQRLKANPAERSPAEDPRRGPPRPSGARSRPLRWHPCPDPVVPPPCRSRGEAGQSPPCPQMLVCRSPLSRVLWVSVVSLRRDLSCLLSLRSASSMPLTFTRHSTF